MFGKKKKQPDVDPREQVEKTVENLEAFVRRAEGKRRDLLSKAKTAKARGDKMSYNMAVNALRMIMQQQKQAEQMSLTMGIVMDTRDVQGMLGEFFSSMKSLCAVMGEVPNFKEMQKAAKEFNNNMNKMNEQTMMMDDFMTAMSESMGNMDFEGISTNDEIGQMIERELANELDAEEIEIEKQLEAAKNKSGING
ncbi:MAG: hypothetical protein HFE35_05085 [Clostridia bacterium]|jgi:hypothetical protein|uniref:hypothetical protein n=1 Tax=Pumilibacter muris TaxID=2941510 RepID=UPI00203E2065|nr:hypothetical protein [Pumilibacter muris]MCI8596171.1 hypothetical protein [Clostridia bacterium]